MTHDQHTTGADGTQLAWSRRGSGSPVVLVHGITESASSFDPITERLATTHEVITMDLRGHGESGTADRYDLGTMAGDVIAVVTAAGIRSPHLVGHSLGGAVVSAVGGVGGAVPGGVASVVDIDQSLQLHGFKELLAPAEPMLRDPDTYRTVIDSMFESMSGDLLPTAERERIGANRRADQNVILGVWDVILTQPIDEISQTVEMALAGYADHPTPYLALFGIDPGDDYGAWLSDRIPGALIDVWTDHGHYPHLVDPERFVTTVERFWANH
jgi:pimeloyl-ACP methyl ester carboxylesterase